MRTFLLHHRRQLGERRCPEQDTHGQSFPEGLLDSDEQTRGEERMAPELEEVVVGAHAFEVKELLPHHRQAFLGRGSSRGIGVTGGNGRPLGSSQRAPVHLAACRQRHRVQHNELRRHHVVRELRFEEGPQFAHGTCRDGVHDHVGHQSRVPGVLFAGDERVSHGGLADQRGLDALPARCEILGSSPGDRTGRDTRRRPSGR